MLMLWIFLTKKIFLAERESFKSGKVFKLKVLFVFRFDAFLTMLNALWWIYKKGHRGMFDFICLVSSVLVTDCKNKFVCFRPRPLELFQCSGEGCILNVLGEYPFCHCVLGVGFLGLLWAHRWLFLLSFSDFFFFMNRFNVCF